MCLSTLSPFARFVLVGESVGASLSPYLHNRALAALGEKGTYEALSLPPSSLATFLPALHARKIQGINITIPYKSAILQQVPLQDPLVQALGATNTLLWEPTGYRAFNTDVFGFEKGFEGLSFRAGSSIAVLGAGGAARAVLAVLAQKETGRIRLVNRSLVSLQALKEQFKESPKIIPYLADDPLLSSLSGLDGIIHASGARLAVPFPLSFSQLHPAAFVYDLNYTQEGTSLLVEAAKAVGLRAQDGRQMLAAQAAKAMALWLGRDPEALNTLYQAILEEIA